MHDIEGGVNEAIANTGREMRRSVAGVAHIVHRAQDDVNDQLAHSFGVGAPQHHADNRRQSGFGAPPGGDGLDDEAPNEEEQEEGELPFRRSSIWFQEERGGLYDATAEGAVNPLREGDLKSDDDDDDEAARPPVTESHAIKLAEADVSMEEGPISHEEAAAIEVTEAPPCARRRARARARARSRSSARRSRAARARRRGPRRPSWRRGG